MSQTFHVDILSDSDTGFRSGDKWRQSLSENTIDLITPPPSPQSKKKQRIEAIANANGPTVFVIDDEATPLKKNSSPLMHAEASSTPFVAETPLFDASIAKCSRGSVSEEFVIDDTPMSGLPQSKNFIAKCNRGVQLAEPNQNFAEIGGSVFLSANDEIQCTGGSEAWESEPYSGSFFVGPSIQLQQNLPHDAADEIQMSVCRSISNDLEDVNVDSVDNTNKLKSPSQILHQQDNASTYMKDDK